MKQTVSITVNGVQHEDEIEPRTLLVHYIRETLGLTGTHIGCDTSQCGACTVHLDGLAVKSCTIFAAQADGGVVGIILDDADALDHAVGGVVALLQKLHGPRDGPFARRLGRRRLGRHRQGDGSQPRGSAHRSRFGARPRKSSVR